MQPFTERRAESVAALGEEKLIAAIRRWLGMSNPPAPAGIGDDCALVPAHTRQTLVTVDPVVFGRHFDHTVAPRQAGAKLVKRNVSDIAAMGGTPTVAVVSLLLDARTKAVWLEEFYRGMAAAARALGVKVVGGDIAQADGVAAATLTLLGQAGRRTLTRNGARAGDWIYVTGVLGNSLASRHHLTFRPRVAEGQWLAARGEVRCLIDVSDGLAKDVRAITPRGAYPALHAPLLPLRPGANVRAALEDGEDYELLFAIAGRGDCARFEREWQRRFPRTRLTRIGRFEASERGQPQSEGKSRRPGAAALPRKTGPLPGPIIDLRDYRGYEHLR